MSLIIERPWNKQPPIRQARPSDYAREKLTALFMPDGAGMVDLFGGPSIRSKIAAVVDSADIVGSSIRGTETVGSTNKGYQAPIGAYTDINLKNEFTAFAVVTLHAAPTFGGPEYIVLRSGPTSATAGLFGIDFFFVSSTQIKIRPLLSTNGTTGWSIAGDLTVNNPVLGVPYVWFMSYKNGVGHSYGFGPVGGKVEAFNFRTSVTGQVACVAAANTLTLGALGTTLTASSSGTPAMSMHLAGIGSIWMPPAEIDALCANPWKLLEARRIWVPVSVVSVSICRPTSDILTTGWTASSGADLYAMVDESVANDSDYVVSPLLSSPTPLTFGITPSAPAGTHTIRVRAKRQNADGQVRVHLLDASNVVMGSSAWQALTLSDATYTLSITTSGTSTRIQIEVAP